MLLALRAAFGVRGCNPANAVGSPLCGVRNEEGAKLAPPALRMRAAILDRFGQMFARDALAAGEIGNRAGDAQDAVVGARREREFFHCAFQERPFGVTERTIALDRKSTRLNSSHPSISYAVFCLKKKKQTQ